MRILDGYTKQRFRPLADGRTIFLPKGEDGPAYLVPDEPTRQRLERELKVNGLLVTVLAAALGRFLYFGNTFHWPLLLTLPVMALLKWRINAFAAERLQEIHDHRLFERVPEQRAAEDSGWQSAALAGGAALVVVIGLAILVVHPAVWVQSVGLLIAAVSAWFMQLALHDVRRSREIRRQHADQPRYERTYEWAGNRRTRRRFS